MSEDLGGRVEELARSSSGREFWRSLDELLDDPKVRAHVARSLPAGTELAADGLSRRNFLRLLGASLALAGLDGCTRMPAEKILPYVEDPPELTPGVPLHYATSMVLAGYATGLLVESHEGRPTKIEGNPSHPASLGAAGVFEQASVLQLYDPNRAKRLRRGRAASSWAEFTSHVAPERLRRRVGARGAGLRLLLEPTSSPLEIELLDELRALYPDAGVHFHAPLANSTNSLPFAAGHRALVPQYDMSAADVILAVETDFLASGPFHLRYARQFADRRKLARSADGMNRLYAVESTYSVTGAAADHRLPLRPSAVEPLLDSLVGILTAASAAAPTPPSQSFLLSEFAAEWIKAVARDLQAHAGRSLVIADPRQPARVQAQLYALNEVLGNIGRTMWFTGSALAGAGDPGQGLMPLIDAMRAGEVNTLMCLGGNPSYATPGPLEFARLMRQVPESVYLGLYQNETARDCGWMIPAAHYLESWGDARAYDGTLSLVQPLLQPLAGGKTVSEVLAALLGDAGSDAYLLLRKSWSARAPASDFESSWRDVVRRGFVEGSALPRERAGIATQMPAGVAAKASPAESMEVAFLPDRRVYDGSFANNGWLQEFPEPLTTLTWDNAAHLSPATAAHLGVENGDAVDLEAGGRSLRIPALIVPGQADNTVALHFGYGREGAEAVARGVGVNVYPFWPATKPYSLAGVSARRAPDLPRHRLALTQSHWSLEGRDAVRTATLEEYRRNPSGIGGQRGRELTLYQPPPAPGSPAPNQWAMTIDLTSCIGCGACVVACQAENNVPVVGREQVLKSREMHWLRIDRYFRGPPEHPEMVAQPMLCQHCEKAPCEYVCPVEATVHSPDGLNEMVYNRCIGTRFCSNNCPYKVRRFNWFDFNRGLAETELLVKNPDVTVRERGVMEKCTFCVQRIREAEITAQLEHRPIAGVEVKTACQQACPTQAIVFGSLSDPGSEVVRLRDDPRAYSALGELGTEPRVRYLARVRNPNPELGGPTTAEAP